MKCAAQKDFCISLTSDFLSFSSHLKLIFHKKNLVMNQTSTWADFKFSITSPNELAVHSCPTETIS